jgi:hypothetical protein
LENYRDFQRDCISCTYTVGSYSRPVVGIRSSVGGDGVDTSTGVSLTYGVRRN